LKVQQKGLDAGGKFAWKTPEQIAKEYEDSPMLVFTGGEPMLHSEKLKTVALIYEAYHDDDRPSLELETNGTIYDAEIVSGIHCFDVIAVSPKLHNAVIDDTDIPIDTFRQWAEAARNSGCEDRLPNHRADVFFKFVFRKGEYGKIDAAEALKLINMLDIPKHKVWIMPEGVWQEDQIQGICTWMPWCREQGFNFSPRLHVLTWENTTGV
jgi:7-carboxy-7-deazaguanine synthase